MPLNQKMADDFFDDFMKKYKPAAKIAGEQVDYTKTPGWRRLVKEFKDSQQLQSDAIANDLACAAQLIREKTPDDTTIKQVKDVVKSADIINKSRLAFERGVLNRVKEPAEECDRMIAKMLHEAGVNSTTKTIHFEGLLDYVTKRLDAEVPRYSWDTTAWEINEKKAEENTDTPKRKPRQKPLLLEDGM
jgi:hypothetical protein